MAISWDIDITNVNVASGRGDVTATRTVDQSSLAPQVYSFTQAIIATPQDRTKLLNTIKDKVEEAAAKQATIDAFVSTLEQDGKANLEAWEATR